MVYRQQYPVIGFLENNLLRTIENDIVAALRLHERQQLGGFYSIPRTVFCYIDYLGSLCKGPPAESEKAMFFLETYMASIDRRYKTFGRLIYEMWRHGTVHEFDPKRLKHSRKKYIIGALANNDSTAPERACHLECFKFQNTSDRYVIDVNLFELADHLKLAINALVARLKRRKSLAEATQKHFDEISRPVTVRELRVGKSKKRKLNLQMTAAVKSQKREIDKKGSVI